jgi:hypothetical protein
VVVVVVDQGGVGVVVPDVVEVVGAGVAVVVSVEVEVIVAVVVGAVDVVDVIVVVVGSASLLIHISLVCIPNKACYSLFFLLTNLCMLLALLIFLLHRVDTVFYRQQHMRYCHM